MSMLAVAVGFPASCLPFLDASKRKKNQEFQVFP
jgi:hypothetical protein